MADRRPPAPAVVLGLSPTGLHVIRALGAAGVEVTGIGDRLQAGRFSRHLARSVVARTAEERLQALVQLGNEAFQGTCPVLIPTSDEDVQLVIDNADVLSRSYAFQRSYADGLAAKILSKDSFYRLCAEFGVDFPAMRECPPGHLLQLLPELSFPCLIKPVRIHDIKSEMKGRKLWIARDSEEYVSAVANLPANAGTMLVQEIIPGPESEITLCCVHMDGRGQAHQTFTGRKLRQFPPGFGSASLAESTLDTETAAISIKLLSELGYRGIAALEFKRHSGTGKLYMIEINVRPALWFALSDAAQRRTVLSAYHELAGFGTLVPEQQQIAGVRWRYLLKDLASALFYRFREHSVLPPPDVHASNSSNAQIGAVFTRDDPAPVVSELLNVLKKALVRAFSVLLPSGNRI